VAGFIVVRRLPVADFAVYTLGTALQGSLSVMSDVGVSSLLVAKGGETYADSRRLSALVAAARAQRRRLLVPMLAIATPLLWFSLRNTIASGWLGLGVYLLVALTAVFQVTASVDGTALLVLLKPLRAQAAHLASAVSRVAGFGVLLGFAPFWGVALGVNALGAGVQALQARRSVRAFIDHAAEPLDKDRQAFRRIVRTQVINAAYYALSAHLTVWIVGLSGAATVVAQIGALGRLSSVFVFGHSAVASFVVPRLARIQDRALLLRRYLQVASLTVLASALILAWGIAAPGSLIWLLGPSYAGLGHLLPIALAGAVTYVLSATILSLNTAKAWIEHAWLAVPITIVLQIVGVLTLDVSSLRGALLFGWLSVAPPLFVNTGIAVLRFRRDQATP